jgi:hypothetical protein
MTIAYPDAPTALALPMSMGADRYQRGVDLAESVWESAPEPALTSFPVQPRTISMFRAEQMQNLPGSIALVADDDGTRRVVNGSGFDLRDAEVIDLSSRRRYRLGDLAHQTEATLGAPERFRRSRDESESESEDESTAPGSPLDWIDPEPFLDTLRRFDFTRPGERGEWRLVAWTPDPHPGQELRPAVDRHRGFRLIVAHLDYGPPPAHDDPSMTGIEPPTADAEPPPSRGRLGGPTIDPSNRVVLEALGIVPRKLFAGAILDRPVPPAPVSLEPE